MNKEEYFAYHRDFCDRMCAVTAQKNQDYAGSGADPFANFRVVEKLGVATVEQGFLTRMSDKFIRITNLSDGRNPSVTDESVQDTLHDLANYCALFGAYLRSKTTNVPERTWPYEPLPGTVEDSVWDRFANPTERSFKIIARDNKGEEIILESCPDLTLAQNRLDHYRGHWPTFKLRIEEADVGY